VILGRGGGMDRKILNSWPTPKVVYYYYIIIVYIFTSQLHWLLGFSHPPQLKRHKINDVYIMYSVGWLKPFVVQQK
jgi:hypothetical protein